MKYPLAVGWIFFALNGLAFEANHLEPHVYRHGEIIKYAFEDTESTFNSTAIKNVGLVPSQQTKYEELKINFSIKIESDTSGIFSRHLNFENATYTSDTPSDFNSKQAQFVSTLVPNFPKNFSYSYKTDAQAVTSVVGGAYAPFMESPTGLFVYYKALDIHTIQSVIDNIPTTMSPGDIIQRPAREIGNVNGGTFSNAPTTIHYQDIQRLNGIQCAYFKVTTMGNKYSLPNGKGGNLDIYTNYQYTFFVPLSGIYKGLLLRGDLQETVTEPDGSIDQRQFSIRILQ